MPEAAWRHAATPRRSATTSSLVQPPATATHASRAAAVGLARILGAVLLFPAVDRQALDSRLVDLQHLRRVPEHLDSLSGGGHPRQLLGHVAPDGRLVRMIELDAEPLGEAADRRLAVDQQPAVLFPDLIRRDRGRLLRRRAGWLLGGVRPGPR